MLVKTYTSPGTSLDLDTPDDLAFLAEYGAGLEFAQGIAGPLGGHFWSDAYE
jgi:2-phospho-L-lactate guanylyltransferase (CobY/MobA/RfbA family)